MCIVLQTKEMRNTFEQYYNTITIDATHCISRYSNVKLITVMAINDLRNEAYVDVFCLVMCVLNTYELDTL